VLALESLLANGKLAVESREQLQAARLTYKNISCDFADALIAQINLARGCEATATFDRKAAKLKGFVHVSRSLPAGLVRGDPFASNGAPSMPARPATITIIGGHP